ncbi:MAG: type II toxin-antitoxin system PemK/MazF family toxin [Ignavibacteriae bacterium]|nr:type II toxin-antitoxin system PemK/MazF family toxin [Ignavibacteriota bacterium]
MPNQREILLLPIPFTDLRSSKRRPVIVVSPDKYNQLKKDILVAAITSNLSNEATGILIRTSDMEEGTLLHDSMIRFDKLYCLDQRIIVKRFGKLKRETYMAMIEKICSFIELEGTQEQRS